MKNLIVYYSLSLNNELLALELQKRLGCEILRIEEPSKRTKFTIFLDRVFNRIPKIRYAPVVLERYDQIILVAPVWMAAIATPLKSFLLRERKHINRYSFISLCGGQPGQHDKLVTELTTIAEAEPEQVTELRISDLLSDGKKEDPRRIIDFRLTEKELRCFDVKIAQFLHAVDPVLY